jgi:hypothetical protein
LNLAKELVKGASSRNESLLEEAFKGAQHLNVTQFEEHLEEAICRLDMSSALYLMERVPGGWLDPLFEEAKQGTVQTALQGGFTLGKDISFDKDRVYLSPECEDWLLAYLSKEEREIIEKEEQSETLPITNQSNPIDSKLGVYFFDNLFDLMIQRYRLIGSLEFWGYFTNLMSIMAAGKYPQVIKDFANWFIGIYTSSDSSCEFIRAPEVNNPTYALADLVEATKENPSLANKRIGIADLEESSLQKVAVIVDLRAL